MSLDRYIGLPYEQHGLDCWGLVCHVYGEELDIRLPIYPHGEPRLTTLDAAAYSEDGNWEEVALPQPYDVILFRVMGNAHVGLYVGGQKFLHMPEGGFACIETLTSPKWRSRVDGYYRHSSRRSVS